MQFFLCITFVAHALALGLKRREGLVSKSLVASAGGFSSTVGEQAWTDHPSPATTKQGDFIFGNAAALRLYERGSPLPLLEMVHPDDPERSGLEDPDDFIRKRMPRWAR